MKDRKLSRIDERINEMRKRTEGIEKYKVSSEVFDRSTLLTLYHLASRGIVDLLFGVIKAGKESNVFLGRDRGGRSVAVKIHLVATSNFRRMLDYLAGDRRFRDFRRNRRSIVYTWVRKEFKNLERAHRAGVSVPEPRGYKKNVVVMEFIGREEIAAPVLKDAAIEEPEETFSKILENCRRLYCRAELVHADLSEYNILIKNGEPYLIDLSQAVLTKHPHARDYLGRDMHNLASFFKKRLEEKPEQEKLLSYVIDCG